jgi:hypothetical protein
MSYSHLQSHQGTPVFIARAVQLRGPVLPKTRAVIVPPVPISPERYRIFHPDRIEKFPDQEMEILRVPKAPNIKWRHELDHDTESVFWLLFYWLVGAQPENAEEQLIRPDIWAGLTADIQGRVGLLQRDTLAGATHSFYQPLWPLLDDLAEILNVDRNWLKSIKPSDPRTHPGYVNEAFQRLLLQFIVDHRDEEFMRRKVSPRPRHAETISQRLGSRSNFALGKRSEPEPPVQESNSGFKRLARSRLARSVKSRFETSGS